MGRTSVPDNLTPLSSVADALPTGGPIAESLTAVLAGLTRILGWFDVSPWGSFRIQASVAAWGGAVTVRYSLDDMHTVLIAGAALPAVVAGAPYDSGLIIPPLGAQWAEVTYTQAGGGDSGAFLLRVLTPPSAGGGGGAGPAGNVTIIAPVSYQPPTTPVAVMLESPFSGNTPGAPVNVADNLVHELTAPAGAGLQIGHHFVFTQIGGDDLQVYIAAAAPAIAVLRRSPYHLLHGIPWEFCPHDAGLHVFVGKAVDGSANADVFRDTSDGGTGL